MSSQSTNKKTTSPSTAKEAAPDIGPVMWQNNRFIQRVRATVSVMDWGVRYGLGAFETVRAHHGAPLYWDSHLHRLCMVADSLGIGDIAARLPDLGALTELLARNCHEEGLIGIQVTGGVPGCASGAITAWIRALPKSMRRGLRLATAPWRIDPRTPSVGAKTLAYLPYLAAHNLAVKQGFDGGMLFNASGRIADGAFFNIFCLIDGILKTPPTTEGALPGVTRSILLDLAKKAGAEARESRITFTDLQNCNLAFVSSVSRGPHAIESVDGVSVLRSPDGKSLLNKLRRQWRRELDREYDRVRRSIATPGNVK